jgi:uncharacterized protein (TIGR00251 family)
MAVTLSVQISPNASRSEVVGWIGDKLKIKIKAPAVEGKANAELLRFVAEKAGVRPNRVTILRGEISRAKVLQIDADEAAVRAAFPG